MLHRVSHNIGMIFSSFWKLALMIGIVVFIGYAGITCFANCQASDGSYKLPKVEKARYEVLIYNTSCTYYTDDYSVDGSVYTLNGYWQVIKNKYVFKDTALPIDTRTFGRVIIRDR